MKISSIRQNLFKLRKKGLNRTLLNRCHIKGASIYLNQLIDAFKDIDKQEIRIVIADLCRIVEKLDPEQHTSFILVSTNTLSSYSHYKQAESLFYNHTLPPNSKENYHFDLLVLYAQRLALEKRIHGILGVDYILNNNKPISFSRILKIVKSLKNITYSSTINWDEIEWVSNWLNHFMHRHIRPQPWIIHQAFEVLNGIFLSSEYTQGKKTIMSIYGSTIVEDYDKLKNEVITILHKNFSDVFVEWSIDKEILEVNTKTTTSTVHGKTDAHDHL